MYIRIFQYAEDCNLFIAIAKLCTCSNRYNDVLVSVLIHTSEYWIRHKKHKSSENAVEMTYLKRAFILFSNKVRWYRKYVLSVNMILIKIHTCKLNVCYIFKHVKFINIINLFLHSVSINSVFTLIVLSTFELYS